MIGVNPSLVGQVPRGIRLNNPCNVDRTDIKWQGMAEIQSDSRFISFVAPQWGFRCAARVLHNYFKDGCDTVTKIINKWAPPTENLDNPYIADVCAHMGVPKDMVLDYGIHIFALLKAITQHEQGQMPYEDAVIHLGVTLEATL